MKKISIHHNKSVKSLLIAISFLFLAPQVSHSQHSVARQWNDVLLEAIRIDFARPTVHSRNLFHTSIALYDSWAAYTKAGDPVFLGNTLGSFTCPFEGIQIPIDVKSAQEEAMSYAAYRLLRHRFADSPGAFETFTRFNELFADLGYDPDYEDTNYIDGPPAALGNYIASMLINFGMADYANEENEYGNLFYEPVNEPLVPILPGNPDITDPNRWQPLTLDVFIDQAGNVIPFNTPEFLGPEWGKVTPFALKEEDLTVYERDGNEYYVYHDPGAPPNISFKDPTGESAEYNWGFSLVSIWSSHLDPADGVMIDISPASFGNIQNYPTTIEGLRDFYPLLEGGDPSVGYDVNPSTGQPYEPNFVPRADYARVLAEFWADGPDSETPPGHWFGIINYVHDHPLFERRMGGTGPELDPLEWDVKAYMTLGGAMHDAAISAWGIKGWYDYLRPVSAIRFMADQGQSTDMQLPNYSPAGIGLVPGYIELVQAGDVLAGENDEHVNKIKLFAWRGPDYIDDPDTDFAGVGWILAENWWPYQRPSFVTPPFAGYISGHSTFSRAAAEVLTALTGDPYFPGGMGVFAAPQNEFLVFEEGPSVDVILQWATYRDASDQTSLSRIWGGIHPPADDIPGRLIGIEIGNDAFEYASQFFHRDDDSDGFYAFEDCDDLNENVYPGSAEICDDLDNDCNSMVDDGLELFQYYMDADSDGFGDEGVFTFSCYLVAPEGFVSISGDCDDDNDQIHPDAEEICDDIDNNCDGALNEGIAKFTYYLDSDQDGYGDSQAAIDTCSTILPEGYVMNNLDCNDKNGNINPDGTESADNGIDEDCNGFDLFKEVKFFPNPASDQLTIHYEADGFINVHVIGTDGRTISIQKRNFVNNIEVLDLAEINPGIYFIELLNSNDEKLMTERIVVY